MPPFMRKNYPITALLAFLCSAAAATTPGTLPSVLEVIDGDTVTVAAPYLPDPLPKVLLLRIAGVDTPELRSSDPNEREAARKAKDFVSETLKNGGYTVKIISWDKYARLLGDITLRDGKLLSNTLIEKGLGVPYNGGRKPGF